jgi:hypothetical protein
MSTIFIQVAAYRDPQLIPTIEDALHKARYPENLVWSIARQYHPADKFDDLSKYESIPEVFKVLNIPHEESQGVCWARHLTQQLYDGEEYTLQIDSHMRFAKDWDMELIDMIKNLQDKKIYKAIIKQF